MIAKIFFNDPENKKFILTQFPEDKSQFTALEADLYPIDYLVSFQRPGQEHTFSFKTNPQLYFFSNGKEIVIDRDKLDILDSFIKPRTKYGFVAGAPASGKTTISQHLARQFEFELIEWDKLIEELKVKLGTDDGPLEEV